MFFGALYILDRKTEDLDRASGEGKTSKKLAEPASRGRVLAGTKARSDQTDFSIGTRQTSWRPQGAVEGDYSSSFDLFGRERYCRLGETFDADCRGRE